MRKSDTFFDAEPRIAELCEYRLMEYRIEQLARAAGVAVDTIRFYQGKGLLEAPRREGRVTWYGDAHLDRLRPTRHPPPRTLPLTPPHAFLAPTPTPPNPT